MISLKQTESYIESPFLLLIFSSAINEKEWLGFDFLWNTAHTK